MLLLLNYYNAFSLRSITLLRSAVRQLVTLTSSLTSYYKLNDLMWQDGLLIDFLQKKVIDKWVRRFLIYSSYLFSERVLFELVVRFYIDFVVWPSTKVAAFDFSNVSMTLITLITTLSFIVLIFNLSYLYILLF